MSPRRAAAAAATLALAAALSAVAPAGAVAPNPPRNIPLGAMPSACNGAGRGAVCERAALHALDHARGLTGLGPYRVPGGFLRMPAGHQWLILANQDRAAYRLTPIGGIVTVLNGVAAQGARARTDPNPWPLLQGLQGQQQIGFGSNWAGGQPNGLIAYFGWMYDDGYGGENIDCRTPGAQGCWGHRQNILGFANGPALSMGVASLPSSTSYALTIVVTTTAPWPYAWRAP